MAAPDALNYRELMKKVEQLVAAIDQDEETGATVHGIAQAVIARFRDELGITGGRLYKREGDTYVLQAVFGEARELPRGVALPAGYAPIEALLARGLIVMGVEDPEVDAGLEGALGVDRFTAVEVGAEEYILAFDLIPGQPADALSFSLGILRHAINQKIRQDRMESVFRQARQIQTSILPRRVPAYGRFDLAGRSDPMEQVGGDFYDFIPITEKLLGVAIADVSGHGLPAALQVRDIYVGLRMGLSRDLKIVRTVERLNDIIHRSTLTSRFVSMFYGELEPNGVFIYVNAGHPPPFHVAADGEVRLLSEGGAVLGPLPGAAYERGFVRLQPGDLIVLYTDGIIEARAEGHGPNAGEEYGAERLLAFVRQQRGRSAAETVGAMFAQVEAWSAGRAAHDDRTAVVVRYPEA